MSVSEDFGFSGQYATKKLNLKSAHWFTSANLIDCKCEYVKVEGSKITNVQLNVFIRKWSNGELSHFKEVKVQMKREIKVKMIVPMKAEVNLDDILKGSRIVQVMPKRCSKHVPFRMMIQEKNGEQAIVDGKHQKFVFIKQRIML